MKEFNAPWGRLLILTTLAASGLCVGIAAFLMVKLTGEANHIGVLVCITLVVLVAGCALFTIRGYRIEPGAIYIQRLLWETRVSTRGLQSASYEPNAMRWSVRTFGNGGLFSFSGRYWNRSLGSYRAFVTDPNQTVVLRFPERTVVLSPGLPGEFVYELVSAPV